MPPPPRKCYFSEFERRGSVELLSHRRRKLLGYKVRFYSNNRFGTSSVVSRFNLENVRYIKIVI